MLCHVNKPDRQTDRQFPCSLSFMNVIILTFINVIILTSIKVIILTCIKYLVLYITCILKACVRV